MQSRREFWSEPDKKKTGRVFGKKAGDLIGFFKKQSKKQGKLLHKKSSQWIKQVTRHCKAWKNRYFPGAQLTHLLMLCYGFVILGLALLLEPVMVGYAGTPVQVHLELPAGAAKQGWPDENAAAYQRLRKEAVIKTAMQTGPVRVWTEPDERIPLSLAMLADESVAASSYRVSVTPEWFRVDLGSLQGTGSQKASYLKNSVNRDVIGWIQIPGTNIDYPVLQGPTLNYYLERDLYKNYSRNGVIWVDSDVTENSTNTVLFGHNWSNLSANPSVGRANDVMFAQLPAFHHLWFAREVPYFYYSTPNKDMVCQIFAVFYTTDLDFYLYTKRTGSALQGMIDKAKRLSLHSYSVPVSSSDRIITLSTCTRALGQREDQRFVVMAKIVSSGDSSVYIN